MKINPPIKRSFFIQVFTLIFVLLLAISWQWTPLRQWVYIDAILNNLTELRGNWLTPILVSIIYILGGLIAFPLTLMIVGTGLAFGAFYGFFYALLGAEISAIVTYFIGKALGHNTLKQLSHQWVSRIRHYFEQQGLLSVVILRVIPVAPFTVINLVAGASHIRFRDFALGSLLGMTPGIFALTLFSDQAVSAIETPEMIRFILLFIMVIAIIVGTWALNRWLLQRQKTYTNRDSA
ncbi:MAG: TVP38/TMEM64 family protein [Nitrosomonas sp.]|nr:TVP38/TMEM64 family protein [Nitrosomonas sp.]